MTDTAKEKRSKWGLFHSRDNDHKDHGNAAAAPNPAPDSAYGGSESSSAHSLEKGHNRDPSQTVTTTTTTTTTTTSGGGLHNTTSATNQNDHSRYVNTAAEQHNQPPNIPNKSSMRRDHSPNFSRPSPASSPLNPNPPFNPANPHSTTLQGLKTAAAGIHGAGETLRGTVNSAVDRQFHAPAGTVAAHEEVANAGRREIESGRLNHGGTREPLEGPGPGPGVPTKGILRKKVDDREGRMRVVNY